MATKPQRLKLKTLQPRLRTLAPKLGGTKQRYSDVVGWSRLSRHERGYGTAWDKLRLEVLKRDGYVCQCDKCKAEGRVMSANQVDHITAKSEGGKDDPANLRAVSAECHRRITTEQRRRDR